MKINFFTTSVFFTIFLAMLTWIGVALFDDELLTLFGANASILPLAKSYLFAFQQHTILFP